MAKLEDYEYWRARLHTAIPGGAHTYSRGDDQFSSNAPPLIVSGDGAYVKDVFGKQYLDYGMALRAVTLGYSNRRVNQAVISAIENGVNFTRPSYLELIAAEKLIDLVPSVEMVKFAKNGSNVTTAAAKIARAFTGRRYICIPKQQPFFSFDDWFIGTTAMGKGVPNDHSKYTLTFNYGDMASLQALFDAYPGEIAAVMLEPATSQTPCPIACVSDKHIPSKGCQDCPRKENNFLHQTHHLCKKHGALFILDEMITGFRWHLSGAQTFYDVRPDLCTFGKGMANGFALAALGGRRDVMEVASISNPGTERTFLLSSTHGAETTGLAAFMEAIKIYEEQQVIRHLWDFGGSLLAGISDEIESLGLEDYVSIEGPPVALNMSFRDKSRSLCLGIRTLFMQEMFRHGVMFPWISVSNSHGPGELDHTLSAVEKSLQIVVEAIDKGYASYLVGPPIKPVFRKMN